MSDRTRSAIVMLMLLVTVGIVVAVLPPVITKWASESGSRVMPTPHTLPSDICMIDGEPLTPELDHIDHGSVGRTGLALKYVNSAGDLVMLVDDQIIGIYEGDFCRLK
jgi:hypothetical protein